MHSAIWQPSCFNPHTHEGCDLVIWFCLPIFWVSIHTPTKGVTCLCRSSSVLRQVSIHTPTKGVTEALCPSSYRNKVSIHTPTKGVTVLQVWRWNLSVFQSTHPRRVWLTAFVIQQSYNQVSIHTPTKGVTKSNGSLCYPKEFQSTHPRRVWLQPYSQNFPSQRFNPHTHEGCDTM